MRNYFKVLQLPVSAPRDLLASTLNLAGKTGGKIPSGHRMDAHSVLLDERRHDIYANTVELYEAMHIASACLSHGDAIDSHHWHNRLAEFDTAVEDSITLHTDDD